ncbi:Ig-like domain-containing protein, partial [Bacillus cereus]|uniref:Ig-like domain-containing protein n=1 Tax=Bacillus cereus TaxID=1396 RepID=UPI001F4F6CAC
YMKKTSNIKKNIKATVTTVTTAGILLTSITPSFAEEQEKRENPNASIQPQVPIELTDAEQEHASIAERKGMQVEASQEKDTKKLQEGRTLRRDTDIDINKVNTHGNKAKAPTITSPTFLEIIGKQNFTNVYPFSEYNGLSFRDIKLKFTPYNKKGTIWFQRTEAWTYSLKKGVGYSFDKRSWVVDDATETYGLVNGVGKDQMEYVNNEIRPEPNTSGEIRVVTPKTGQKAYVYFNGELVLITKPLAQANGTEDEFGGSIVYVSGGQSIELERITVGDGDAEILSGPNVNKVTDISDKITGKGQPDAIIKVKTSDGSVYSGVIDGAGEFSVQIPRQKKGSILEVTQTVDGETSMLTKVTVEEAIQWDKPTVNEVTNRGMKVTGKAQPGAHITLTTNYERASYQGTADSTGNFEIALNQPQKVGTKIAVIQSVAGKKDSDPTVVEVQAALEAPKLNPVSPTDTIVTGTGTPNTTAIAKIG